MPIEIRELHIKVSVTSPQAEQTSGSAATPAIGNNSRGNNNEEIVAACVEKVMEVLQNKTER